MKPILIISLMLLTAFAPAPLFLPARAADPARVSLAGKRPCGAARMFLDCTKIPATAAILERFGSTLPGKNSLGAKP